MKPDDVFRTNAMRRAIADAARERWPRRKTVRVGADLMFHLLAVLETAIARAVEQAGPRGVVHSPSAGLPPTGRARRRAPSGDAPGAVGGRGGAPAGGELGSPGVEGDRAATAGYRGRAAGSGAPRRRRRAAAPSGA